MSHSWHPVLIGRLKSEALAVVDAVIEELPSHYSQGRWPPGLIDGHLGFSLFFDVASRLKGERYTELLAESLQKATAIFGMRDAAAPGLHGGLSGLGWAVQHLGRHHDFLEVEELCTEVDGTIDAQLRRTPTPYACDLRDGLAGLGLYALKRMPQPAGRAMLERVVERMDELAQPAEVGLTWPLPRHYWSVFGEEARFPDKHYNLGVAHGLPPALAVLAAAYRLGVCLEKAERLLHQGFAWVRSRARPGHPDFPHYFHGTERVTDHRYSWCTSNPSITAVLWWAAKTWGHPEWVACTREWTLHVAREALEKSPSISSNLCCGTAGTAQLYLRLFHATREPLFEEVAVRWLQHTLALRQPGLGVGGYCFEQDTQRPAATLQFGAPGIALTLLAAASDMAPDWDEAFLYSLLPTGTASGA